MSFITVSDRYQSNYTYELTAREGRDFAGDFTPAYTPQDMLEMGVFEGSVHSERSHEWHRRRGRAAV